MKKYFIVSGSILATAALFIGGMFLLTAQFGQASFFGGPTVISTSTPSNVSAGYTVVGGAGNVLGQVPILYANEFSGSDIGAQLQNAAAASLSTGGAAQIPPGVAQQVTTPFVSTVGQPMQINCSPGSQMTWVGSTTGTAITLDGNVQYGGSGNIWSQSSLSGCQLSGATSTVPFASTTGVHFGGSSFSFSTLVANNTISKFGTGINMGSNSFLDVLFKDVVDDANTALRVVGGTNSGENNISIATDYDNCKSPNTSGLYLGSNSSFTSLSDSMDNCGIDNSSDSLTFTKVGGHMENPGSPLYPFFTNATSGLASDQDTLGFLGGIMMNDAQYSTTIPPYYGYNNSNHYVFGLNVFNNRFVTPQATSSPEYLDQDSAGNFVYSDLVNGQSAFTCLVDALDCNQSFYPFGYWSSNIPEFEVHSNGDLSLGTSTPIATLQIQPAVNTPPLVISSSSGSTIFEVANNNNIGINSSTPDAMLAIQGSPGVDSFNIASTSGLTLAQITSAGAINFESAGNSNVTLNTQLVGGLVALQVNGSTRGSFSSQIDQFTNAQHGFSINPSGTASNIRFSFTGAADTNLTAGAEAPEMVFNMAQTRQHATGTAISLERDLRIEPTTDSFSGVMQSAGFTNDDTVSIDGPPIMGVNATSLNVTALQIGGEALNASTSNSYGIFATSSTGAVNNYAMETSGRVVHLGLTTASATETSALCLNSSSEVIGDTATQICGNLSAARYKQNITPLSVNALGEIEKFQPVQFNYKSDYLGGFTNNPNDAGLEYGLIADQVQKVDPHLVVVTTATTTFEKTSYPAGTVDGLQQTNYWVGLFTKAIQQQQTEIQNITVGKVKRSAEENWQWLAIGLLALWCGIQQYQISKLKK